MKKETSFSDSRIIYLLFKLIAPLMESHLRYRFFNPVKYLPSPTLPLDRLLPEMHRLLKSEGRLAVWTALPWWSPGSLTKKGFFAYVGKEKGVHTFRRIAGDRRSLAELDQD